VGRYPYPPWLRNVYRFAKIFCISDCNSGRTALFIPQSLMLPRALCRVMRPGAARMPSLGRSVQAMLRRKCTGCPYGKLRIRWIEDSAQHWKQSVIQRCR